VLDCGGRPVALDSAFLHGVTRAGEPTLVHGYAITGHVAQGLTVDRAFVLAAEGINREWAYVALSRGRLANRLYAPARTDGARREFAPFNPEPPQPIARLAAAFRNSTAQVLAIDRIGTPAEPSDARLRLELAARERHALEARRLSWLPGRRRELERARKREATAAAEVGDAERTAVERDHAARPFVTERDLEERRARRAQLIAERRTERLLDHDRRLGRGL
jgi:hypothetical protein